MRSNEKKVILNSEDIHKISDFVTLNHIQNIFKVTAQAIYHHIRSGRLIVYKWGHRTLIDPLEYANMKKWDRSCTKKNGQKLYDDNNLSISHVSKKLGISYHHLYYLIQKGDLAAKKIEGCIVLELASLLACDEIKENVRRLITDFANDQYIDSCNQRHRSDYQEEVSAI